MKTSCDAAAPHHFIIESLESLWQSVVKHDDYIICSVYIKISEENDTVITWVLLVTVSCCFSELLCGWYIRILTQHTSVNMLWEMEPIYVHCESCVSVKVVLK